RALHGEGRSLLGTILGLHPWSHFSHRGPGDGGDGFLALANPFSQIDCNVRARNPERKRHNGTYADGPQVRRETGVMGPLEATAAQMSHMIRSLVAPLPVRNPQPLQVVVFPISRSPRPPAPSALPWTTP